MKENCKSATAATWAERLGELREAEWKTRCRLQALAEEVLKRIQIEEQKLSLGLATDLCETASKFGRLAIEGVEEPPLGETQQAQWLKDIHAALDALYRENPKSDNREAKEDRNPNPEPPNNP